MRLQSSGGSNLPCLIAEDQAIMELFAYFFSDLETVQTLNTQYGTRDLHRSQIESITSIKPMMIRSLYLMMAILSCLAAAEEEAKVLDDHERKAAFIGYQVRAYDETYLNACQCSAPMPMQHACPSATATNGSVETGRRGRNHLSSKPLS